MKRLLVFTGAPSPREVFNSLTELTSADVLCNAQEKDNRKSKRRSPVKEDFCSYSYWSTTTRKIPSVLSRTRLRNAVSSGLGPSQVDSVKETKAETSSTRKRSGLDLKQIRSQSEIFTLDYEVNKSIYTEDVESEPMLVQEGCTIDMRCQEFESYFNEVESEFLSERFSDGACSIQSNDSIQEVNAVAHTAHPDNQYWDANDLWVTKGNSLSESSAGTPDIGLELDAFRLYAETQGMLVSEDLSKTDESSNYLKPENTCDVSAVCCRGFKGNLDSLLLGTGIIEKMMCCVLHVGYRTEVPTADTGYIGLTTLVVCDPTTPLIRMQLWRHHSFWGERLRPTDIIMLTKVSRSTYKGSMILQTTINSKLYNFHCPTPPYPDAWSSNADLERLKSLAIWSLEKLAFLHANIFKGVDVQFVEFCDLDDYSVVHLRGRVDYVKTVSEKNRRRTDRKQRQIVKMRIVDDVGLSLIVNLTRREVKLAAVVRNGIGKFFDFMHFSVSCRNVLQMPEVYSTVKSEINRIADDATESIGTSCFFSHSKTDKRKKWVLGSVRGIQLLDEKDALSSNLMALVGKRHLLDSLNRYTYKACNTCYGALSEGEDHILKYSCNCRSKSALISSHQRGCFPINAFRRCLLHIEDQDRAETLDCVAFASMATRILKPLYQTISATKANISKLVEQWVADLLRPRRFLLEKDYESGENDSCLLQPWLVVHRINEV